MGGGNALSAVRSLLGKTEGSSRNCWKLYGFREGSFRNCFRHLECFNQSTDL